MTDKVIPFSSGMWDFSPAKLAEIREALRSAGMRDFMIAKILDPVYAKVYDMHDAAEIETSAAIMETVRRAVERIVQDDALRQAAPGEWLVAMALLSAHLAGAASAMFDHGTTASDADEPPDVTSEFLAGIDRCNAIFVALEAEER